MDSSTILSAFSSRSNSSLSERSKTSPISFKPIQITTDDDTIQNRQIYINNKQIIH